jgi:hypothetical protein
VPGVIGSGVPSLSQVYDWDTAHLHHAAAHWPATAERWEESFAELYRGVIAIPSGMGGYWAEAALFNQK